MVDNFYTSYSKMYLKPRYIIELDYRDGTDNIDKLYYLSSSATTYLEDAERVGYTFLGWYTEKYIGSFGPFEREVTKIKRGTSGNLYLYAQWELNDHYITYDLNGGEFDQTKIYLEEYSAEDTFDTYELPEPIKKGYKFIGWYEDDNKVTSINVLDDQDYELTAKWQKESYNLILNTNDGLLKGNDNYPELVSDEDQDGIYQGKYSVEDSLPYQK